MTSKFRNELTELVKKDIISETVAEKIDSYYEAKTQNKPQRLFTIFGILGSCLVGLGIILILAHNWDDFSRLLKTVFAFLPLVIGQILCAYSILKNKDDLWKESSATFLFFSVGATISLISQIYHIPGNLSGFLLTWTLLCLPIMYLLKSKTAAILTLIFSTYYAINFGYSFMDFGKVPWYYIMLILGTVPFYLNLLKEDPKANIVSVFNWLLPLSITLVLGTFVTEHYSFGFLMYVLFFGLCYNLGKLPLFHSDRTIKNGYSVIGALGTVIVLLTLSFRSIWKDIEGDISLGFHNEYLFIVILLVSALLVFIKNKEYRSHNLLGCAFLIFTIGFLMGQVHYLVGVLACNLLLFFIGVFAIKRGVAKESFKSSNLGLLIISVLIICRFFDTDMSFVLRGLLFLGVGVSFFITNYYMLKKVKNK